MNTGRDFLIMLNSLPQMHLKLPQKEEATVDLIGNKIADKITKISRSSPQNNSEMIRNETENIKHDKVIPKERYISPEGRHKVTDDLRLI